MIVRRAGNREAHTEPPYKVLEERAVAGDDHPHEQERRRDAGDGRPGKDDSSGWDLGDRKQFGRPIVDEWRT